MAERNALYPYAEDAFYVNPPNKLARPSELRSAPPTAYPSTAFWNNVTEDPAWHERIGSAQAAAISAINSLGFGMPMALAKQVAPDKAAEVQNFLNKHSTINTLGSIAGAVANPANGVFRAAGNALASRGYGIGSQAVADGLTMGGVMAAPGIVAGEGFTVPPQPLTAAMAARFMMPTLPASVAERVLTGVGAGGLASAPSAIYNRNLEELGVGLAIGGAVGGLSRRTPFDEKRHSQQALEKARERYLQMSIPVPAAATGINALSMLRDRDAPEWGYM